MKYFRDSGFSEGKTLFPWPKGPPVNGLTFPSKAKYNRPRPVFRKVYERINPIGIGGNTPEMNFRYGTGKNESEHP